MAAEQTMTPRTDNDENRSVPRRSGDNALPDLSTWTGRAILLWQRRRALSKVAGIGLVLGLITAFSIPRRYTATATIMPQDQGTSSVLMLAALAGHASGLSALSSLAGGLLGMHSSTAVYSALLRSGSVADALIQRFGLMQVYHSRYHVDAARRLARNTTITEDKKSGTLTIRVEDRDPVRARDLTQSYLEELNKLVARTTTSHAHQERLFVEARLKAAGYELESAQVDLSNFSTQNSTIDLKEQTRAMMDAGARVQAQLIIERSGLQSLRQVYTDQNIQVRESAARIGSLEHELHNLVGSRDSAASSLDTPSNSLSPSLRQLPRLAVTYADLYRRVRVQESVYELLTQEYEASRIAEARDLPTISVIDQPGIPEKKSFPPRLLLTLGVTVLLTCAAATAMIVRAQVEHLPEEHAEKQLFTMIMQHAAFDWLIGENRA